MKTTNSKSKNVLKQKSNQYIVNECMKILTLETNEQTSKWFLQNSITSYMLRNQKVLYTIELSNQILRHITEKEQPFLNRLIHLLNNNIKSYEFCRFLKHFAQRDYEFEYVFQVAKGHCRCPINFYLRSRNIILKSHLNRTSKQILSGVVGEENEWFKVMTEIFKKHKEEELINIYIDIVKKHYVAIKKNQNEILNGSQVFKIGQLMRESIKKDEEEEEGEEEREENEAHDNFFKYYQVSEKKTKSPHKNNHNNGKNIMNDLEAEDRQFIRALSYKDDNIARLLENKHNKMIDMIQNDVEDMRKDIEEEKRKYVQIVKEKNEITKEAKAINECALSFISKNTKGTEDKLIELIAKFNEKHFGDKLQVQRIKKQAKQKRLIEQIERQEMQID